MYRELPGILPGLVGYWQFNEGIGDTTFDKTLEHALLNNRDYLDQFFFKEQNESE